MGWTEFVNSTVADANQVNANFDYLQGNIIPFSSGGSFNDNKFTLGSSSYRWSNIYSIKVTTPTVSNTGTLDFLCDSTFGMKLNPSSRDMGIQIPSSTYFYIRSMGGADSASANFGLSFQNFNSLVAGNIAFGQGTTMSNLGQNMIIKNNQTNGSIYLNTSSNGSETNAFIVTANGDCTVKGALTKGSGSFDIPHLIPEKRDQNIRFRHYFVESNTPGTNIYRKKELLNLGENLIYMEDYYDLLNTNTFCMINENCGFGSGYGEYVGSNTIKIITNTQSSFNVLIFGDRCDEIAMLNFNKFGLEYKINDDGSILRLK